ncbi:MAG: hypothetical protein AAF585_11875 [Verrucomicrobiota bacterium]
MDFANYEHHRPDYEVFCAAIDATPNLPVFSGDRIRVRNENRKKDPTPDEIRRMMYQSVMAGGVGGTWGYLIENGESAIGPGSWSFPNREQLKAFCRFFFTDQRFTADMERVKDLGDGDRVVALADPTRKRFLIYGEEVNSITLRMEPDSGKLPVSAIDTKKPYELIDLGELDEEAATISLPYSSDWAVTVGFPNPN